MKNAWARSRCRRGDSRRGNGQPRRAWRFGILCVGGSPGLVSNSCGVVSRASAKRRMTDRRGSAVPFAIRLRKGRPTPTMRANFCFVIFACLRRRVTLRPRMTEVSLLLSKAACCELAVCPTLFAMWESLAALAPGTVTAGIRFGELLEKQAWLDPLWIVCPYSMPFLWRFAHR